MANIFSIFGQIFVDNEKANKAIDETTNKGKQSSKSFGESFMDVTKKAVKIGTAVVGTTTAIVTAVTAAANKTAQTADTIDKGSIRMGVSTKYYQELAYASGQCGVEMANLEKAAKKLEGTDLTMEDAMNQIMSYSDASERAKKASELFGNSIAYTLSPLIEQSTEDYNGLIDRANELGIVMSEDAVKAGVTFGDTMSDVKQSLGGIFNSIMSQAMPILTKFLNLILTNLPRIQQIIDTLGPVLVQVLETILPIFMDFCDAILPMLVELIEKLLPPIAEIIQQLLPIVVELIQILLPPIIQIVEALLPPLLDILEALMPILKPILDIVNWAIQNVLMPVINVITSIINVISKGLTTALKALKPVVEGIRDIFSKVFGGLFNIVKAPINFIIDGINLFIKALNKIKVPDWVPGIGGKGINIPLIKKLRVGIDYVPYDEMPALLHKGEKVMTADEVKKEKDAKDNNKQIVNNYNNTIVIEHMEVKEKNDIQRIAEELYWLTKKQEV